MFDLCYASVGKHGAVLEVDQSVELDGGAAGHLGVTVSGVQVVGQAANGLFVLR